MLQEHQKNSDNIKLRRHKTRNGKAINNQKHYTVDKRAASSEERNAYDTLIKNGNLPENTDINIGIKRKKIDGSEKYIIVDPKEELSRVKSRKYTNMLICFLAVISLIIALFTIADFFFTTPTGQKLASFLNGSPVSENGNYNFGKFDDYVTIGDSYNTAIEILGSPETIKTDNTSSFYYYNDSYIIVKNETVVGYYKASDDDFKVTVGERKKDIQSMIFVGDDAKRVVDKLGSPDHYLKQRWIYYDMDIDYKKTSKNKGKTLTVNFDDKYIVTSINLE
ncbi:MAG: hypothetical protein E7621_03550 [Ruminococcaceae bacterium]|nr:hypothetical protein [Oscillospiraceae bacterium]